MKFGHNFHLFQVPKWEPFYVNYDLLKSLFNRVVKKNYNPGKQSNLTGLYSCLFSSIDIVESFQNNQFTLLRRKEDEFCKRYDINISPSEIPALDELDYYEALDLLALFIELRRDLNRLQWYSRVNQDAIRRIFAKLEKFNQSTGPSLQDQEAKWNRSQLHWDAMCLKDSARLDKVVADIRKVHQKAQYSSTRRSLYLKRICNSLTPALKYPSMEYQAIRHDGSSELAKLLHQMILMNEAPNSHLQTLFRGLLQFSMMCQSRKCTVILLSVIDGDFIDHNGLNRLISITGRNNAMVNYHNQERHAQSIEHQRDSDIWTNQIHQILDHLSSGQIGILRARDTFGRSPLHYAALYGMSTICQSILNSLQKLGQNSVVARDAILSADYEGYTPLLFGVTGNHTEVTRLFLKALEHTCEAGDENLGSALDELFFLAVRYQYDGIVGLLASTHLNLKYRSSRGQSSLYVAAQQGRGDYVKIILMAALDQNVIDSPETTKGWTPLFISSSHGHLDVVEILLQAGASQTVLDSLGWTAKEHAVFRGHLAIANMLNKCFAEDSAGGPASRAIGVVVGGVTNHFVHDHDNIIVNLGVTQNGKQVTAVDLNCCSSAFSPTLDIDSRFSIEVSTQGGNGESVLIPLPILDDTINNPFIFPVKGYSEAQLVFKVFCAAPTSGSKRILIGSGRALLANHNNYFGARRESLIRTCTIPILEKETLDFMGMVTFTFMIAKPYIHGATHRPIDRPSVVGNQIQLVGHRGLGQNTASKKYLQIGENTVESFLSAAKLGASFVEFDVQLTRDLVPVIYHDFSLSESGTDIPIHDLTLQQFIYASKIQSPSGGPISVLGEPSQSSTRKPRSRSLTRDQERGAHDVQDRLKLTVDFMNKGFKPNTRGDSIQDTFATLEELLVDIPTSIGFSVEIKYPRLHEAIDAGVAPVAIELNTFVDTALEKLFRFGGDRSIILSSFTPEVCILLSVKQQRYPVMLITNAGKLPAADKEMRGGSLQIAIRFAKQWNLAGIVFASEALLLCPRLVKYVKNSGLECASYGLVNNIPENAKALKDAGVNMIIADRVGIIAKCLNLNLY